MFGSSQQAMEKPKRVIGYTRVSTDKQMFQGHSINVQREKMENYCRFKGLILVGVLEESKSGKTIKNRPILMEIIRRLKLEPTDPEALDGIICAKLDRLGRNAGEIILLTDEICNLGKHIYFTDMDFDINSPSGQFLRSIFAAFAQLEREMIAQRTREVLQYKRMRNERVGVVPFGKKLKFNKDTRKNVMIDNPNEKRLIRRIFQLKKMEKWVYWKKGKYRARPYTCLDIADQLTKEGFVNRNGNPYNQRMVWKILHNKYRGLTEPPPSHQQATNEEVICDQYIQQEQKQLDLKEHFALRMSESQNEPQLKTNS